jgi:hypothetical protein
VAGFDGVYRNCLVWLNGHILGRNVSGYSSFYFDATPYANPGGTNVLVVRVDASRFEGWFYEGAGIYRHVWLTTKTESGSRRGMGNFCGHHFAGGFQCHPHRANRCHQPKRARDRQWQFDFDHS